MKFAPGDKVSFVNEKQNGIVKGYRGNLVLVEIEDGFELPANEQELVKVHELNLAKENIPVDEIKKEKEFQPDALLSICIEEAVTAVIVPESSGAVLTGKVSHFLVNRTSNRLLFGVFAHIDKKWKGFYSGICDAGSVTEIFTLDRPEMINISSFLYNGIFHIDVSESYPVSFRKETGVVVPSIQLADKNVNGILSFAQKIPIYFPLKTNEDDLSETIKDFETLKQHFGKTVVTKSPAPKTRPGTILNEKEVDLHIEELVTSAAGLTNAEMLQLQISRFSAEMDAAIRNHFHRIIFIHGVGNGRLKQEIRMELKKYKGVTFRDADQNKYGSGATEVNLT